jgi:hypothetical protein
MFYVFSFAILSIKGLVDKNAKIGTPVLYFICSIAKNPEN